ncbi:unnamed protein product [Meganyctiphanes norvegica]|uniref:5'-nucleotidase domain-containing protein 3 n=1 Tax=Meganyctiphanes norvegica TaxID=48144 RepID=A0AAV2RLY4_MEGNR
MQLSRRLLSLLPSSAIARTQCCVCASRSNTLRSRYGAKINVSFSTENQIRRYSKQFLKQKYEENKTLLSNKKLPEDVDKHAVFASNELNMSEIKVYGFDYDYTIANYLPEVEHLIYELGKNVLVNKCRYPDGIKNLKYNREFAIRGLHYDVEKGLLMKLDQFQQIQRGSIYRGLTLLSRDEIRELYGTRTIPLQYLEGSLAGGTKMAHLADLFSIPEMCLLRQIVQFFLDNDLHFHSVSIFNDVKAAIGSIHPEMHRIVTKDASNYLMKDPNLIKFFDRLKENGKELFLITNSPFRFVNAGMTHILNENWREYFDVIITNAKKPNFFTEKRPFRILNEEIDTFTWDPVEKLEKGKIYAEGSLYHLKRFVDTAGQNVLYFGDHPYADLADLALNHSWRTGAIVWELDYELEKQNSLEYKKMSGWFILLQSLIEEYQDISDDDEEAAQIIQQWKEERNILWKTLKDMYNPHFGSVFRTFDNPTYFSRRLFRYADIYTSQISNLCNYKINHTFYPRRGVLPHEYKSLFV